MVGLAVGALLAAGGASAAGTQPTTVVRVVDGDTIEVSGGVRVRLVQIDAPELGSGECYSRKAAAVLRSLLPTPARVRLEGDARLDARDRYGRLLRYVHRGSVNVNLELVRRGAATVWFYGGDQGRYARSLLAAARKARTAKRGLWGACQAVWDPYGPATTSSQARGGTDERGSRCDPSYPDVCIAPPPPDLDCGDVPHRDFRVVGADPHRFDGDRDGEGCEG
jgi:micrococcal nuclease